MKTNKLISCTPRRCNTRKSGIGALKPAIALALLPLLVWSVGQSNAQTASIGIQWVVTGVPITDPGGAFGVPTANWTSFFTTSGTEVVAPPSGGILTITWSTGGGLWESRAIFSGFSAGENQVFSGCLYAMQNDSLCGGPITVTVSGMSTLTATNYSVKLMAAIDGSGPAYTFQPAIFNGTTTLNFDTPVNVASNGTSIASVTTNLTLSGDSFSFTICNDEYPGILRAELSGMTITYTPLPAPVITTQPQSQTVAEGGNATFTVTATNNPPGPLTYQWLFNETNSISGANSASYSITGASAADAGNYRVVVSNTANEFTYSADAALIVAPPSPFLLYDPSTMSGYDHVGSYAPGIANYFSVSKGTSVSVSQLGFVSPDQGTNSSTVTVQLWDAAAQVVLGTVTFPSGSTGTATGASAYLFLAAPTNSINLEPGLYAVAQYGGDYASAPLGVTTNTGNGAIVNGNSRFFYGPGGGGPGTLPGQNDASPYPHYVGPTLEVSVSGKPAISNPSHQPRGGTFPPGSTVTLSVTAGGSLPLSYQWYLNGVAISGANSSTLVLTNVTAENDGAYSVIVSNSFGSITSAVANVVIAVAPTVAIQLNPGILVSGTVGGHYQVQYTTSLSSPTWILLEDIPSLPTSPYLVFDPTPISTGPRYYRAILAP